MSKNLIIGLGAGLVFPYDYALQVPSDLAPGAYTIELGAYEYPNLTRLQLYDSEGKPLGDHMILYHPPSVK